MDLLIVIFFVVVLTACIIIPLRLIDWFVFRILLRKKANKYAKFYELSVLWLTWSCKLPFRMCKRGAKYGWLGAGLMFVSPAAIATYAVAYYVQQVYFPFPLSEKEVPYKTHDDLVAITELKDFPTFTYSHNKRDVNGWSGNETATIYYVFDQPLPPAFAKKLNALCDDPDNCIWYKNEGNEYNLQRGFDGKYIKSSIKDAQIKLSISQSGFVVITQKYNIIGRIEDFAERDTLSKNTGVTFPKYKLVNYEGGEGMNDYSVTYYLLMDEKPSKNFIQQLENSPKWTKKKDGTYSCSWGKDNHGEEVTVDKNSRVVKATYRTY